MKKLLKAVKSIDWEYLPLAFPTALIVIGLPIFIGLCVFLFWKQMLVVLAILGLLVLRAKRIENQQR